MPFTLPIDPDVSLLLFEPHHAESAFDLIDRNREHLRRWLPWPDLIRSVEDERQWLQTNLEGFARTGRAGYGLLYRGELVGGIGNNATLAWQGCDEVGYWLDAAAQGKGIVTRACRGLLGHLFARGVHRVHIRAEAENVRSCRVPERLGFIYEGTLRHVCRFDGRWVDHRLYAMLAEDWRARGMEGA